MITKFAVQDPATKCFLNTQGQFEANSAYAEDVAFFASQEDAQAAAQPGQRVVRISFQNPRTPRS